jgi:hypothetical protein
LITLIMLAEEYKLWSSSLCSFLNPPVTSSLFGPWEPQTQQTLLNLIEIGSTVMVTWHTDGQTRGAPHYALISFILLQPTQVIFKR